MYKCKDCKHFPGKKQISLDRYSHTYESCDNGDIDTFEIPVMCFITGYQVFENSKMDCFVITYKGQLDLFKENK